MGTVATGMIPSGQKANVTDVVISYYVNEEQYTSEKDVARQYAGQKVWPRAVYIRRARRVKFALVVSFS